MRRGGYPMTEGDGKRNHAVYAMPKQSSSLRKSSYDALSAAARSGDAGLPTSITSGPLRDRTLSGLTLVDEQRAEPSIYYGSIIGSERTVVFHLRTQPCPCPSTRPPHGSPSLCRWLPLGDDDPRTLQLALALLSSLSRVSTAR